MLLLTKVRAKFLLTLIIVSLSVFATFINSLPSVADTLEGTLSEGTFEGKVTDAEGAKVYIAIDIEGPSGRFTIVTDNNGEFSIPVDQSGRYTITIDDGKKVTRFDLQLSEGVNIKKNF